MLSEYSVISTATEVNSTVRKYPRAVIREITATTITAALTKRPTNRSMRLAIGEKTTASNAAIASGSKISFANERTATAMMNATIAFAEPVPS